MKNSDNTNILFIVIDSLRSDRCHGQHKSPFTPNLDMMIKNGVLFTTSVSVAPSTSVSLASIFTGLYPFKTGMSGIEYERLDSKIPNFVDFFKNSGYTTHATSSDVNDILGITTDFDLKLNSKNYTNFYGLFRGLGEKLIEKISSDMQSPWFYYIHIYDLHEPIIVPHKFNNGKYGVSQYDRMLSSIDNWLGNLLRVIDINKTMIVITADHGDYVRSIIRNNKEISMESSNFEKLTWKIGNNIPHSLRLPKKIISKLFQFTRSKYRKHKIDNLELSLYEKRLLQTTRMESGHHIFDDLLLVPLIFYGNPISSKQLITNQVRSIDIFPTIFDLCKLDYDHNIDGTSLNPLINGEKVSESPAYIESMPTIKSNVRKMIGIRTSEFKYIRSKENYLIQELYDLKNDPHEEKNIAKEFPEIINKMENILTKLINQPKYETEHLEKKEREKVENELRKLGYV